MLENLNSEQTRAVLATDGPLLVLAGAGTGKTRVLTTRIAHILNSALAMPWQILALTFTNKAANEMKMRLGGLSDGRWNPADIWCGTFHSICLRILRSNADAAGLRRDFLIYGEDDQKAVIKSVMATHNITTTKTPAEYVEEFSNIKDRGLDDAPINNKLFDAYNAELTRLGAVDFGDIILRVLRLFKSRDDILARYRNQFKYILVDEFQDTNNAQMQFLQMLAVGDAPNICCVGDDDQSIYSWRGAEIRHILNFERTFPGAQIIRLETNYRSTPQILGAANSLIRHNAGRLGKDLHSPDNNPGESVYIVTVPTDRDEARMVADIIGRGGVENYSNCAVLIRAGASARVFEEEFAARHMPYRLIGATKFYDRMEIRDAIAYLRLLVYPFDDISFLRVIGRPRRGFGDAAIAKIRAVGAPCLMDGLRVCALAPRMRAAADEFLDIFNFDYNAMAPSDAAMRLLERAGYIKMWNDSKDTDAADRIANIRELVTSVISKYDTMAEFLEQAALMMTDDDADEINAGGAVSVMTIHAAKGLEFDTVFLPAWEEGMFPNDKAIGEGALEEERRLAYVAITRARRRAIISNAMSRMVFGTRQYNAPSRFIAEMDTRFLNFQGAAGNARPQSRIETSYGNRARTPRPRTPTSHGASLMGQLVSHPDLGTGVVIEDNGDILTVAFKSRGIRKVARGFVTVV